MESTSTLQLLRHATVIITINSLKILVDPMLSAKAAMEPIQNCGNDIRIPMVDLPVDR
jgi:L-ascorbate metabolism protein UlaG (beta-lactamase superfamily)